MEYSLLKYKPLYNKPLYNKPLYNNLVKKKTSLKIITLNTRHQGGYSSKTALTVVLQCIA